MGLSSIAAEQREKEVEALKSFLTYSLIGSLALHIGVLTFGIGNFLNRVPEIADELAEVAIVDPPIQDLEPKQEESIGGSGTGSEGDSIAGGGGSPRSNASTAYQPPVVARIAPSVPSINYCCKTAHPNCTSSGTEKGASPTAKTSSGS